MTWWNPFDPDQKKTGGLGGFGGFKPMQQKRAMAGTVAQGMFNSTPRNFGEGLNHIGKALMYRKLNSDADKMQQQGQQQYSALAQAYMQKLQGGQPQAQSPGDAGMNSGQVPGQNADPYVAAMGAAQLAAHDFAPAADKAKYNTITQMWMQRNKMNMQAQQATADRKSDREDWQWKQDYQRANPAPAGMQIKKLADGRMYHVDPTGQQPPKLVHPGMDTNQISNGTEYGLNPQYGVDANGNPVMVQVGKNGTATQTQMPDGVTLSKSPIKLDAGTHFVLLDPITRQPVGKIEKNVAGTASARAVGTAQGEAQVELPKSLDSADQTIGLIDKALSHRGLDGAVGNIQGRLPDAFLTNDFNRDFIAVHNQLVGKSFLEGLDQLRGSGAISEIEGQKAQNAIARLSLTQSEAGYREALRELREIIALGRQRSQQTAGVTPTQVPGANAGEISDEDLLKLYSQ